MKNYVHCIKIVDHESPRVNHFLATLLGSNFLINVFDAMTMPFLAILLIQRFGLGPAEAGLLVGTVILLGTLFSLPGGVLSDRFGHLPLLTMGYSINAAGLVGLSLANSLGTFVMSSMLLALGRAFSMPSTVALLTLLAGSTHEMRVRGYRYMATNIGFSVGPLLGAALGIGVNLKGFMVAAGINIMALALLARAAGSLIRHKERGDVFYRGRSFIPFNPKPTNTSQKSTPPPSPLRRAFLWDGLRPNFMKLHIAGAFVTALAYAQHQSTLSQSLFVRVGADGLSIYALLMTLNGITAVAAQIPMNALSRHIGPRAGIMLGHALYAAGFVGFALPTSFVLLPSIAMILFTLGEVLCVLNVSAVPILASDASDRGRYLGAAQLGQAGMGMGPMLGGVLLAALGARDVWFAVTLLLVIAVFLHLASLRSLSRSLTLDL